MAAKSFFIVFGKKVNNDFSNVKVIETKIIPNIGESFVFKKQTYRVQDKLINYSNVEDYSLEDDGRGGELIYCYVTTI